MMRLILFEPVIAAVFESAWTEIEIAAPTTESANSEDDCV